MLALFVLTTLTLVALYLGSQATINRRIAGDDVVKSKALHCAEAGVYEAIARIQNGQGPDPYGASPAVKVVQVLNATSVGSAGADTTLLATGQPIGEWLPYSTATRGGGALTIEFHTNPARTAIYKYDKTLNPPLQTAMGAPIFRITSTGRAGAAKRTIVAEVTWNPVNLDDMKGALVAGQDVKFTGNAVSCGYNHRADTPNGTGADNRVGAGGCAEDLAANPPLWEWNSGSTAGIWSTGDGNGGGASNAYGTPATLNYQAGFPAGPWEPLGMTPAQFWAWVGSPVASLPATPNGVYYLDNDATHQNRTGDFDLVTGQGFLYCDGDLKMHADWRGMIYVEGDMKLNSQSWIIGAVYCRGAGQIKFNGGATILYSYDAISRGLGNNVTLRKTTTCWSARSMAIR